MQCDKTIKYIGNIEDDNYIEKDKTIVICGIGKVGKRVYEYLANKFPDIVLCDALNMGNFRGNRIISYNEIKKYIDAEFFVTNLDIRDTVILLKRDGIKNIHIITR